jgi:hypothetical protein
MLGVLNMAGMIVRFPQSCTFIAFIQRAKTLV